MDSTERAYRAVLELVEERQFRAAAPKCQELLLRDPGYAPAWYLASRIARAGRSPQALDHVRRALALQPMNPAWRLQEATCLLELGRREEAEEVARTLLELEPRSAEHCAALGELLMRVEQYGDALRAYRQAIEVDPTNGTWHFNCASLLRTLGDFAAAEQACERAIQLEPRDYEAYGLRSSLRKQTADRNHVTALEAVLATDPPPEGQGRIHVCYALAKEYEDLGRYAESFAVLERGAQTRRRQLTYDVQDDIEALRSMRDACDARFFSRVPAGYADAEPIFIVGMPRTGTTLLERILASHSVIHSAGELTNFERVLLAGVRDTLGRAPSSRAELIACSTRVDFARLGKAYVDSVGAKASGHRRFVDKMPMNFVYAGLIRASLPNAKILHMTRNPMDTCYAVYKTLFNDAYPFSYDLDEFGRYFVAYREQMAHWHRLMPGFIHDVSYERLVEGTEAEVRRILAFIGIPWEPAVLRFHESSEPSTTASAVQARAPISRSSVRRWLNYAEQLEPVRDRLRSANIQVTE